MRKTASIRVFVAVLVLAGVLEMSIWAASQQDDAEVSILEGLKGVSVEVVQPASGFENKPAFNPVKVEQLHSTAERLLSEAKIEVFDGTSNDPNIGHVAVTINVWKTKIAINFITHVKVELYQQATVVRDDRFQILTPTWPLGATAVEAPKPVIVTHHQIVPTVRRQMETQIKILISDYLKANPLPKPDISGMMTGTVRRAGSINPYVIMADNGVQYDPVNLPHDCRRDGLRIAFRARRTVRTGMPCIWEGIVIKITKIIKL